MGNAAEELTVKYPFVWDKLTDAQKKAVMETGEDYKRFLDAQKPSGSVSMRSSGGRGNMDSCRWKKRPPCCPEIVCTVSTGEKALSWR